LGQASAQTAYWTGVALPMVLIGVGQGLVLAPLTAAAMADVSGEDAGAASGMVNVAHQLGGSLGLAVLVAVFAMGGAPGSATRADLAQRIDAAMSAGALMLALALIVVLACIVRRPAAIGTAAKQALP